MSDRDSGGTLSLAHACYRASNGDYELALLLALDFRKLAARPRWPLEEGEPGPRIRGTATQSSTNHDPGAGSRAAAPPGSLTAREDVAA